jgi:hypothetical protein
VMQDGRCGDDVAELKAQPMKQIDDRGGILDRFCQGHRVDLPVS